MKLQDGATLGSYKIIGRIGRGGMSTVYRAYHQALPDFFADDPLYRERFQQEARSVARLKHPNILEIYDFGYEDDLAYLVLELVEGGTLADRLGRRWLGAVLSMATALFAGLAFGDGLLGFWLGNVTWSLLASAASPILGAWFAELFPTRARATAVAVATVAGSLGGIVGLELVAWLDPSVGLSRALLAMATGGLAGSALLALLPETRGKPLPD